MVKSKGIRLNWGSVRGDTVYKLRDLLSAKERVVIDKSKTVKLIK